MAIRTSDGSKYQVIPAKLANSKSVLQRNGKTVMTPGKNPLAHQSTMLLKAIATELSKMKPISHEKLSLYSMLCTQVDFLEKRPDTLGKEIEDVLLDDIALRTCAGPEEGYQLDKLSFLLQYLEKNGVQHPRLSQTVSGQDLKKMLKKSGEYATFLRLVEVIRKEYLALPVEKRCAVLNATSIHQSTILGMMLALGKCTPKEYARALNAANCIGGGIWGTRGEEKEAFKGTLAAAGILYDYTQLGWSE